MGKSWQTLELAVQSYELLKNKHTRMTKTKAIHVSHIQKEIFWAVALMLIACVGLYMYFLCLSIKNVAVRQDVNEQVVALRSKVASLEFQYVALQNSVTGDIALAKGFVAQAPKEYVTKEAGLSFARP